MDYRLDSEFTTAPLQKGDILLLCSDGLTNAVPREQLEQLLRTGGFYDLPDLLIRTANENGGPDNITALLLCVECWDVSFGDSCRGGRNVPGSEKRTKPGIKEDIRYCAANDQRKRTPRFF